MASRRIEPLGAEQTSVLVTGTVYFGVSGPRSTVGLVLGQNGKLVCALQAERSGSETGEHKPPHQNGELIRALQAGRPIPGADGAVWWFKPTNLEKPDAVPFVLEKYHSQDKTWKTVGQGALPRRKETSGKRRIADVEPLGVDAQGRAAVVFGEGNYIAQFASKIDSIRFVRISSRGTILNTLSPEKIGLDGAILNGKYFSYKHYQLMPDGSILAQYATLDRYKILRIHF